MSESEDVDNAETVLGEVEENIRERDIESQIALSGEANNPSTPKKSMAAGDTNPKQSTEKARTVAQNESLKDTKEESSTTHLMKAEADSAIADDEYAEHVTYADDGSAIYTDPRTKEKYNWSEEENKWMPSQSNSLTTAVSTANPYENEHYKWCEQKQEWVLKEQETEHYRWDAAKKEWVAKTQDTTVSYDIDEQGQRTRTDKDGTVFFWDVEKNAWFPKIDDDFMARYQMSYGFIDNTSAGEQEKQLKAAQELQRKEQELQCMAEEAKAATDAMDSAATAAAASGVKRKATQEPPKWFDLDPEHNTKVYISNLPLDITIDEFAELMGKCGMIMRDPQTQKYKLKLYTEADGQIKGDGLCDYIKVESVDLALNILDEYNMRGNKIRVQRAEFQMRGEYNPALKPKRKKKDKEKLQKMKEKLFDWRPEKMRGERTKNEKVVILKNLFHPDLFEKEVQLILDYQNDLREECGKCGTVRKVVIYDRHAEGVAQVNMSSPEEADLVIQMMQGRFFGKRQLSAEHWDGKTKYKITESAVEVEKRLSNWDQFLETDENKDKMVETKVESKEVRKHVQETLETIVEVQKQTGRTIESEDESNAVLERTAENSDINDGCITSLEGENDSQAQEV